MLYSNFENHTASRSTCSWVEYFIWKGKYGIEGIFLKDFSFESGYFAAGTDSAGNGKQYCQFCLMIDRI